MGFLSRKNHPDITQMWNLISQKLLILEYDGQGQIIGANPAFLNQIGYSLSELKNHQQHLFDGDMNVLAKNRPQLAAGQPVTDDLRCRQKNGQSLWLTTISLPHLDRSGRLSKITQCGIDMTKAAQSGQDAAAQLAAIGRSQAIIEFDIDGRVLTANENFLAVMGYSLPEIIGQPHRLFVDPAFSKLPDYAEFLKTLKEGRFVAGSFKRISKSGREVWLQATYNPILDADGRPYKIVKYAVDVTAQKMIEADYAGQITAINLSQAVIEFTPDFTILTANQNFLDTMGYRLEEIKGQSHAMFVTADYRNSADYANFRRQLTNGQFQAGEFKRITKSGREVWLQATYNPIRGLDGRVFKIVKYAVDVTARIEARLRTERIAKMIHSNLGQIDDAIAEATRQSVHAASASQQTSANVQSVAAGAEELSTSVREISASMSQSRMAADQAFDQVSTVDQATRQLAQSADAMLGIVDLIQGIAGQINLLALNATIESARAGEAGKGFAVVATEVKNLATQARNATERISDNIDQMRQTSGNVVGALGEIRSSIGSVRDFVTSTAAAVEEQNTVTRQISENMQSAAGAVQMITDNIQNIAEAADNAHESTRKVREAADGL